MVLHLIQVWYVEVPVVVANARTFCNTSRFNSFKHEHFYFAIQASIALSCTKCIVEWGAENVGLFLEDASHLFLSTLHIDYPRTKTYSFNPMNFIFGSHIIRRLHGVGYCCAPFGGRGELKRVISRN